MPILHTHRRGIYLIEHAGVYVEGEHVVYGEAAQSEHARSWNIPGLNSAFILLGQGSSITQPAVTKLTDDGVLVAFTGSGGFPLVCASQDYRPTEFLHTWLQGWMKSTWKFEAAKKLAIMRVESIELAWKAYTKEGFKADPTPMLKRFRESVLRATDQAQLMGAEAEMSKVLYKEAALATRLTWTERTVKAEDRANSFLDHGNKLAYGVAATILWVLGIPPSLAVCHGRNTAGGLMFDLADVIKDAVVLPTAFQCAAEAGITPTVYRERLVSRLHDAVMLDTNGCLGACYASMMTLLASCPAWERVQ